MGGGGGSGVGMGGGGSGVGMGGRGRRREEERLKDKKKKKGARCDDVVDLQLDLEPCNRGFDSDVLCSIDRKPARQLHIYKSFNFSFRIIFTSKS